ncbi:MAG TPA: DNA repair protein RadC [Chthoniobacterales bacterium]|jgi:DNA repair protein RadC
MARLKELPAEELPRERLQRHGAGSLSNAELIAILLRTGMEGTHVLELADQLLSRYQTLTRIARCSVQELSAIKGVGPAKAVQLAAAFALGNRLGYERMTREPFESPEIIYQFLAGEMRSLAEESLRVLLLDTKLHLMSIEEISKGSINETVAHVPSIFKPILVSQAYASILVHNHPSGNPEPSSADNQFTRRLAEVAQLMQVRFLDHMIFGMPSDTRPGYFSYREGGLL